ncbi:hypothetical protein F5B21DRAFT_475442 [Xylaria acuta]|nr:hypothetical protein F5B21DRAFT_475442 [Xylaria acuta]
MTVVAIHQIAVQLFKSETSLHKDDRVASWHPPLDSRYWQTHKSMPPTLFRHPQYRDYDRYPHGSADGVGYWAENRILGGLQGLFKNLPSETTPLVKCLIPIYGIDENRRRIDPEATLDTGVYRYSWERKPLGHWDPRDVIDQIDYLTLDQLYRTGVRAGLRKQGCRAYYLAEKQLQHEG